MPRRVVTAAASAVLAVPLLAGCSHAIVVEAAPYAADPECARVMLAIPEVVGGLEMRTTTSQATQVWGDDLAITARCGVEPPGPTTDTCVQVDLPATTVDWLVTEEDADWVAVTFGRSPALELTVPKMRADEAVGEVLAELSPAAGLAPSNGLECS